MNNYWKLTNDLEGYLNTFQCGYAHFNITFYVGKKSVWILSQQMDDNALYKEYISTHDADDEGWEDMTERWWYGEFVSDKVVDSILIKTSKEHYELMEEKGNAPYCDYDIFQPRQGGTSLSEIEFKEYGFRGKKPKNYIILS